MTRIAFGSSELKGIDLAVCIGVFDGLHLGHLAVIDRTVSLARENGWESMVITFSANPKMEKGAQERLPGLTSPAFFEEILSSRGINHHCVIDFSDDMSKLTGEEFIALLCTSYRVRAMVVGDSFRAGRPPLDAGPSEIAELLRKYTSSAYLRVLPPVVVDGTVVSSSAIRRCLLTGDLGKASGLLGRAYSLDLRNVSFEMQSPESSQNRLFYDVRTLGLLLPKAGEYEVEATAEGITCKGKAFVSENRLALELPVRTIPDGITFLGA